MKARGERMNWKTIIAIPITALVSLAVIGVVAAGIQVGSTWDKGQTSVLVNGLVMVCWGSGMFGVFVIAILVGAAMATRIMGTPNRSGGNGAGAGRGWGRGDEPKFIDDYAPGGKVIDVYPSVPGARPLLPGGGGTPVTYAPRSSGAFDGMDDGDDGRYGQFRG